MHGHVEPEVFADDSPFADPAQLLIVPDHYVFRMLASQGIEPLAWRAAARWRPVETDSRRSGVRSARTGSFFRGYSLPLLVRT
jgi:glucuronate isomerase